MGEDDWDEFYRMAREIFNRLFNEFLKDFNDLFEDLEENPNSRRFYGFKIEIGPDGIPRIYRFGDEQFEQEGPRVAIVDEEPNTGERLIDVYDEGDAVRVVVEFPGIGEQNISVKPVDDRRILLEVVEDSKIFRKEIDLPADIEAKSIKYYYRNGLIEIVALKKRKSVEADQR
ncbi:MAG: Hsp20/alpha crystallin family protein [Ignisphaera sp.]